MCVVVSPIPLPHQRINALSIPSGGKSWCQPELHSSVGALLSAPPVGEPAPTTHRWENHITTTQMVIAYAELLQTAL